MTDPREAIAGLPDIPNPFQPADSKIGQANTDPTAYHLENAQRGDPAFVMSNSGLSDFVPEPIRWRLGGSTDDELDDEEEKKKKSKAIRWGNLVDALTFWTAKWREHIAVKPPQYPDDKTGAMKPWSGNSTWCKNWMLNQGPLIITDEKELAEANKSVKLLRDHPETGLLLENCDSQVEVQSIYRDRATGLDIPVKGLIDIVPHAINELFARALADLKTTRNSMPLAWEKEVEDRRYFVQAALYMDLWNAATPDPRRHRDLFLHAISQNTKPYIPKSRILSEDWLKLGRHVYVGGLRNYAWCLKNSTWPDADAGRPKYQGWTWTNVRAWTINNVLGFPTYTTLYAPDAPPAVAPAAEQEPEEVTP